MHFSNNNIAIIGLGYVGLPLAVAFGSKYNTIGFDINTNRVAELASGIDKTLESDADKIKGATQLKFSSNIDDLKLCDLFIVTVPTPINQFKAPDLAPLLKASEMIGKVMKKGAIVIYESTVYPGCTEEDCVPILEKYQ
jgi:UDP-N-acetyl-D-galactosamine dehydrogenase